MDKPRQSLEEKKAKQKIRSRRYYEKNKELCKQRAREWAAAHPKEKKARQFERPIGLSNQEWKLLYARLYYQANLEKKREQGRTQSSKWRKLNPDRAKAADARYKCAHPSKIKERSAKYFPLWKAKQDPVTYRDRRKIARQKWAKANPELNAFCMKKAAHKRRGLQTTELDIGAWKAKLTECEGLCVYCDKPGIEIDHLHPIALGGANEIDNCAPSCRSCNARKSAKSLLEWLTLSLVDESLGMHLETNF